MKSTISSITRIATVFVTAMLISSVTAGDALAGSCCGGGSSETKRGTQSGDADCHSEQGVATRQRNDPPFEAPHGGQLSKFGNYYEVVYGSQETRVYVYDMFRYPLAARAVQGDVVMRVRSTGREFRYPLQYVPAGNGQDYLVVRVDLTRVRDGDMDFRFELRDVPGILTKTARFEQQFTMSRRPDDARVSRLPALQQQGYGQIAAQQRRANPAPRVVVDRITPADNAAIRVQQTCPVMNEPLGSHGPPTKLVINGRQLFVCCAGCVDRVRQNPDHYLARVDG